MKSKLNEIMRNVMKLLAARDKVLWEGEAGKGDTLTIPGLSHYSLAEVWTKYGQFLFNPQRGYFGGIHSDQSGASDTSLTHHVYGVVNGDRLTIRLCQYYAPEAATPVAEITIRKVIGVEPIQSKILSGGGRLLEGILAAVWNWSGGVWHEINVKHYPAETDERRFNGGTRHCGRLACDQIRQRESGMLETSSFGSGLFDNERLRRLRFQPDRRGFADPIRGTPDHPDFRQHGATDTRGLDHRGESNRVLQDIQHGARNRENGFGLLRRGPLEITVERGCLA